MFRKHGLARGYETLIIFVAVILSSVLLVVFFAEKFGPQTADRGRQAAIDTASESGGKALKVLEISVEDGTDQNPGSIDYMYMKIKLAAGSEWVSLNRTLISIEVDQNMSQNYDYSSDINCSVQDSQNISSIYNQSNFGKFGVNYLFDQAQESGPGVLTDWEMVLICFKTPRRMSNDENLRLTIVPSRGVPFYYEGTLPQNLNKKKTIIYERA